MLYTYLDLTVESFWKLVSQYRFRKLKDFALNIHSMFGNSYVYKNTFSTMKQVKSKNRNRTAAETLDDSLRLATTNIGIDIATIVSETLDHRHPTDRDL